LRKKNILSKYQLDSNLPKVYKFRVIKKSLENDLLEILIKNLDFRDIIIQDSYAVYPEALVQSFFIRRSLYQTRLASGSGNIEFFSDSWKRTDDVELRNKVFTEFTKKVQLWPWNESSSDISQVPILAMAHGTDLEIAWKITRGGFVALQKLDSGYYGRGIYLTSSAWYTVQYFVSTPSPCVVICLVLPCNPYPVIESPKKESTLIGKDILEGYQSHYVITGINGLPIGTQDIPDQTYDELVVQGEEQVLPIFVIKVDKVNLSDMVVKMQREIDINRLTPELTHTSSESDDLHTSLLGRIKDRGSVK